jgi:hypothetical protein
MAQQNPFGTSGAGANAFKAAYDRLKAEAESTRKGIGENYANAYQQLRQQGYGMGLGAAAQRGLSGGQAAGVRGQVSAQQMGQLGQLMQGQERALREQKAGEQSIYSNALLEGRQAQQYEREDEQYKYDKQQKINEILKGGITEGEQDLLDSLGYVPPGEKTNQSARTDFVGNTYYKSESDARGNPPTQPGRWVLKKIGNEYVWDKVSPFTIVSNKERETWVGEPVEVGTAGRLGVYR